MHSKAPEGWRSPRPGGLSTPHPGWRGLGYTHGPRIRILLVFAFLFLAAESQAHDTGSSYLKLTVVDQRITGRLEISVHDLAETLNLDANADGTLNQNELGAHRKAIQDYAIKRLGIGADGIRLAVEMSDSDLILEKSPTGTNVVLNLVAHSAARPDVLEIEYRLFFETKPLHRGLLFLECEGRSHTAMFSPDRPVQRFELGNPDRLRQFLAFGWDGVWHIWIGFDHVLFLLALLLPAVLTREAGSWRPVAGFREAFVNVFKIVTAFTVAHSITLSLAALEVVQLDARWVESAIAASVMVAALNNLRPFVRGRVWLVAFGFGLIHGFGFANVLAELDLPRAALVLALVSFNLGVEAGQLVIVGVFLPVAYNLRHSRAYQGLLLRGGSVLIVLIAGIWIIERLFGLELMRF